MSKPARTSSADPIGQSMTMLSMVPAKRILVGFSGGKDSLVTLDLCVRRFGADNVEAFFMSYFPGMRCQRPTLAAAERFGVKLHEVPHWGLSRLLRDSYLRKPSLAAKAIRLLKQRDIEDAMRQRTGINWIALGHRCVESVVRNAMLKKNGMNGFDVKGRRIYPIALWKTPEVFAYLRARQIPQPVALASKQAGQSGGIQLTPYCMTWLKQRFPDDYEIVKGMFPYVDTMLIKGIRRAEEGARIY